MDRRRFHRLCGEMLAGAAAMHASSAIGNSAAAAPWPRSRLVTEDGQAMQMADLSVGDSWIVDPGLVALLMINPS